MSAQAQPHAEINVTPLIDVMLVLLIVFMVGLPLLTRDMPMALPQPIPLPSETRPEPLTVRLDAGGNLFLDDVRVEPRQLAHLLRNAAASTPQPPLQLDVADEVSYQRAAEVISMAHNARLTRIGFATP